MHIGVASCDVDQIELLIWGSGVRAVLTGYKVLQRSLSGIETGFGKHRETIEADCFVDVFLKAFRPILFCSL
ncbi:hypothetical protein RHMOL_Rhmol02G0285800 [Rhododendron molle]|uniref:Uncharacterized protein n=2 Tax=Rhododendron molle TaxID=49168 RepID=A0ACC0PVK9_RHOML|nr:hypothetical protein RHMOL_Rhmol02G0285800 [Rhododendron molle]KAI8569532.1 hypothetical protein RHMOL_Rhmol02G0285800 [Rhododendron molle]